MRAIVAESADQLTWQEIPDIAPDTGALVDFIAPAELKKANTA